MASGGFSSFDAPLAHFGFGRAPGESVAIGFATAFLGLAVLMPVIGYATWHGYRDAIQAEAWPENAKLPLEVRA